MTTIVTRAGKGSPLTNNEMDSNLTNLNTYKVETNNPSTTGTLTHSGDIVLSGSGKRITGDFSNATITNRLMFQTSTVNGNTNIHTITNGTGSVSSVQANNSSDPANGSQIYIAAGASVTQLVSDKTGTGTYLPMTFYTGGLERMRIDTSGNVLVDGNNLNLFSAKSLAATGYQKLPSGLIIQWGYVGDGTGTGNSDSVTFPIAFPNVLLNVQLTVQHATAGAAGGLETAHVEDVAGQTGFTFSRRAQSGATTSVTKTSTYWLAIGY